MHDAIVSNMYKEITFKGIKYSITLYFESIVGSELQD